MDDHLIQLLAMGDSPEAQTHILTYFEQLKKEDMGWKICGDLLARNLYQDDRVKFFCLQVIESHIKNKYPLLSHEEKLSFRACLQQWYKQCCAVKHGNFVINKTSQLFCLMFILEYPHKWPTFFEEVLSLLEQGALAVDMYLRVLIAIDEEVVARCIPHTQEEFKRNTDIKDYMRDHCVTNLVESWYSILKLYEGKSKEIICLCLKVIGAYISWIDINLIANDQFISSILFYLKSEELREQACECLLEITNKGMDASGKTALVESLSTALGKEGVLMIVTEDANIDFIIKLSALLNGMGVQLITSLNKITNEESSNGLKFTILQAIDNKVPHMIRFLGDDDDDVSEGMFEFCHSYLSLLKQLNGSGVENCRRYVKDLLSIIVKKMKFDDEFDFEDVEGDSEAEFLEFRKQMKILLNNLAKLDGDKVLSEIYEMFNATLSNWQALAMQEVEVAIHVLYCLGEAYPGQILYTDKNKTEFYQNMMRMLISSNVSHHQHAAVRLEYFETVTRYERFFYGETQHIPVVLASFLDERGLRSSNKTVSSRTSFLLMRFVKSLKNQVQPYVEDILKRLQGLLVNVPDVDTEQHVRLTENDRYYLYEIAAVLITCSNSTKEKQLMLMNTLLSPIMLTFQKTLDEISVCQSDPIESQKLAFRLHHLMANTSRASKAFSTAHSLKISGCTECFKEALAIFLRSLTIPVHREIIHNGVRQYLHRMIICLHEEILPFVPVTVTHLLKDCEMRDIQEFIPLINQLITRFKNEIAPFLGEILMPLVRKIFAFLQPPNEANDQQALKEKQLLQRSYFLFIATIVNTNILEVLSNQESQNINDVLLSVVHGASEVTDPQAQKTCFLTLNKLVDHWGVNDSFQEFIYKSILPACFMAPLKPTFDLNDAQTLLVLQEIANTQKTTLQKHGMQFIYWLERTYLPENNCPPEIIQEYSRTLQTVNPKVFKNYLKEFYARAKT